MCKKYERYPRGSLVEKKEFVEKSFGKENVFEKCNDQ